MLVGLFVLLIVALVVTIAAFLIDPAPLLLIGAVAQLGALGLLGLVA